MLVALRAMSSPVYLQPGQASGNKPSEAHRDRATLLPQLYYNAEDRLQRASAAYLPLLLFVYMKGFQLLHIYTPFV